MGLLPTWYVAVCDKCPRWTWLEGYTDWELAPSPLCRQLGPSSAHSAGHGVGAPHRARIGAVIVPAAGDTHDAACGCGPGPRIPARCCQPSRLS